MLDDGVIDVVQKQLRHSDPRMTLGIYSHVVGGALFNLTRIASKQAVSRLQLEPSAYFGAEFLVSTRSKR